MSEYTAKRSPHPRVVLETIEWNIQSVFTNIVASDIMTCLQNYSPVSIYTKIDDDMPLVAMNDWVKILDWFSRLKYAINVFHKHNTIGKMPRKICAYGINVYDVLARTIA